MVITYFFRRILMFLAVLFICPFVAYGAETCSAGQMLVDGACVEPAFTITTTDMAAESTFSFKISATGTFYVDFDDGRGVQKIVRTNNIAYTTYTSAAYANAGTHIIKMYGKAKEYSTSYSTAAISFVNNTNIKSVDGSLGAIFGGSTKNMFYQTFYGCTSLQYISGNLFDGVTDSAESMFDSTFYGCTSLKEIHATLFSGVNGSAESMFYQTFRGCTSLESLPDGLFSGVKGSANDMFNGTFYGCTSLKEIHATLFSGVNDSAEKMFYQTFDGCTSLESLPDGLFSGVKGSANDMFGNTFNGCTSLKKIPDTLFSGVNGSAENMFVSTFYRCTSLESLPDGLFSGVSGSAGSMFRNTFFGCTSLKSLPKGLFKNIEGRPATGAFNGTFGYCSDLSGYIPSDMFEKMDSTDFDSATMSGIFTNTALDTQCPAGTYQYITGFESDWSGHVACASCPENSTSAAGATDIGACVCNSGYAMVDGVCTKVDCAENQMIIDGACVEPRFTITTTNMAAESTFSFQMSAAGVFYVDFDDGRGVQKIDRTNNTTNTTYTSAAYANAGTHIIKMYGNATGYAGTDAAISFSGNTNIVTLGGSLGAIFGGSANRMFYQTFYGCTSLQSIPATLFSGVSGSAIIMFYQTFYGCTSLQKIPENLFSGVRGSANYMFYGTFYGCTSLQSIPVNLFEGVRDSAESMFDSTFADCTSLQSIPVNLFEGVRDSAEHMFSGTFRGCTSLQKIPDTLFSGVSGSAESMFSSTFYGCTSLQKIPDKLFEGVSGSARDMFFNTFRGCTSLQKIPDKLFEGVNGSALLMFRYTFSGCTSLESLPDGLFKNIKGKPAYNMFEQTFSGCSNLSGYIPSDMFEKMDSTDFDSATMSGIFTNTALDTQCPTGTYQYITGFESAWNGKVSCEPCPDGMCSINKPCSPSANATGETTCQYNANTGDYSDCDECRFVSCNDGYQYINGECKIAATCNPGQYLPAGASECAPCPAGHYCIGNTAYMYNPNYDQGISGSCNGGSYSPAGASECTECPIVTDPYGGLIADVYSYGVHDSIDTCVATYYYMPEYMLEVSFGMTVQDAIDMLGYNPDSDANKRGIFMAQCHYDTVTQQYTKNCAGLISMCEGGYYTNAEINAEMSEEVPSLEASTLEEMLNTYCVPAEPGYWSPGLPHTDLENITQEEVSLTWVRNACPAGTTSAAGASDISHCVGGRTLHIGDDITMNLTTIRPETPRVMVFQVLDELYYGGLSDTEKTINKNTDKKFRIFFDNKDYWLHDYTVE